MIEMPTKLLKGKEMIDYWNDMQKRFGKDVMFLREAVDGIILSDRAWNAIVYCHYMDEEGHIDYIRMI